MNLIVNNCIGAMCYKLMGIPYGNPFMWSLVSPVDFIYLINNFDSIDFQKITLPEKNKIKVDSTIDVKFPHYKTGAFDKPTTIGSNVFCNNISEYVTNKWNSRLTRMLRSNEPPVFIISDRPNGTDNGKYSFNDTHLLSEIRTSCKVIFIGDKSDVKNTPKNIISVQVSHREAPVKRLAEIILEGHLI